MSAAVHSPSISADILFTHPLSYDTDAGALKPPDIVLELAKKWSVYTALITSPTHILPLQGARAVVSEG